MVEQTTLRGVFLADVLVNERMCDEHYRMVLSAASFPPSRAGQFVQIMCRPPGGKELACEVQHTPAGVPVFTRKELTEARPLLRRPLSLAGRGDYPDGSVELELIYRTIGVGTHWLATVHCGAVLSMLGPLGNAFTIDPDRPLAALVGGGVGIPPMLYLGRALIAAGRDVTAFAGARSASLLPLHLSPDAAPRADGTPGACLTEFADMGAAAVVATDDGSLGFAGFVTEPLAIWLDARDDAAARVKVYTCGPEPMMRVAADLCAARGVPCEVSMERHMACGMGTCQSCICKVRSDAPEGWTYKLCCTDGPVFDAAQMVWD